MLMVSGDSELAVADEDPPPAWVVVPVAVAGAQWHCYRFEGARPHDVDARNAAMAVPPLVTRAWLDKPAKLRQAVFSDVGAVEMWLSEQVAVYGPRLRHGGDAARHRMSDDVSSAVDRVGRGRDVVWGHWLSDLRYLAVAVLTVHTRSS